MDSVVQQTAAEIAETRNTSEDPRLEESTSEICYSQLADRPSSFRTQCKIDEISESNMLDRGMLRRDERLIFKSNNIQETFYQQIGMKTLTPRNQLRIVDGRIQAVGLNADTSTRQKLNRRKHAREKKTDLWKEVLYYIVY